MREKINSFNAAFVDLAAAYVKHIANKMDGNTTYTPEPSGGPLRWGMSMADEIRAANLLAATIGKMQAANGGELPQDGPADNLEFLRDFLEGKTRWNLPEVITINVTVDASGTSGVETTLKNEEKEPSAGPEPVAKLGPGASFRRENTHIHGQCETPEDVKVEAVERLQNLCSFCKEMVNYRNGDSGDVGKQYRLIRGRAWGIDVVMLEFAISVLSELKEIREVRIPAQTDTPGAWELLRGILAGKWQAPEGCAFNVTVDASGKPLNIDPEPQLGTARALAIAMPGGETVKLNSAAEAYQLAGCIEKMAASVWPEMADSPAPGGPGTEKQQ